MGEASGFIRSRVMAARSRQLNRFHGQKIYSNAHMGSRAIRRHCAIGTDAHALLERAIDRLGLSARAYDRILKVSRTIAETGVVFAVGQGFEVDTNPFQRFGR